ncbi:MAG: radical SAM protein [Pseudomonadota bacterium]
MRKMNKLKALLIFPPMTIFKGRELKKSCPPLGLAYIAAYLRENGYSVTILDTVAEGFNTEELLPEGCLRYGLNEASIKERIRDIQPDVVGVSCLFSFLEESMYNVCRLAKEVDPEVHTVVGGAHPTALPEKILADRSIDFVVLGEGEEVFLRLLEALQTGGDLNGIGGLGFKARKKTHINLKDRCWIKDLDLLPFSARDLLPMEKYQDIGVAHGTLIRKPYTSVVTSRGCPWNCIFCSVSLIQGQKFRTRSVSSILQELTELVNGQGIREIYFEDDSLLADRQRALGIFDGIIDRKLDLVWSTPNGISVDHLDEELLKKMKNSGCYNISLAIESGSQYVLDKIIRKPLKLDRVPSLVDFARKIGIAVNGFFIIGLPGETKEMIWQTIDFAETLALDNLGFFIATPYPGTRLLKECQRKGLLVKNAPYLKYRFSKGVIRTKDFTPEWLEEIRSVEWKRITDKNLVQKAF